MRNDTVNPTPPIVPLPTTAAQPTVGRSRPRLSLVSSQDEPTIATGLPSDVPGDHAEGDRRADRVGEEPAGQRDAGVGQPEQRHDAVAGPRVVDALQPLVRRQGRVQPGHRGAGQLRGRLLAEPAEQPGRLLQALPPGRVRRRGQPDRQPGHHRVDPAGQQRRPHHDAGQQVRRRPVDAEREHPDHRRPARARRPGSARAPPTRCTRPRSRAATPGRRRRRWSAGRPGPGPAPAGRAGPARPAPARCRWTSPRPSRAATRPRR